MYQLPPWSQDPSPEIPLSLQVMKSGVLLERIDLASKPYFMVGRVKGVCDVFANHPTISRQHAVIQHGGQGKLFLFDLGSTHGTMVNMEKVRPKEFVPLHVGDMILFGFSSRFYFVDGPEHLRPPELQEYARKYILPQKPLHEHQTHKSDFEGETAVERALDEIALSKTPYAAKAKFLISRLRLTKQQRVEVEQDLQGLRDKRSSESDALNDAEIRNLEENEFRIQQLDMDLEQLSTEISAFLTAYAADSASVMDEADEYYDRSAPADKTSTQALQDLNSEAELIGYIETLQRRIAALESKIQSSHPEKTIKSGGDSDALDRYMADLARNTRDEDLKKYSDEISSLKNNLTQAKSRLGFVKMQSSNLLLSTSGLGDPKVVLARGSESIASPRIQQSSPMESKMDVDIETRKRKLTSSPLASSPSLTKKPSSPIRISSPVRPGSPVSGLYFPSSQTASSPVSDRIKYKESPSTSKEWTRPSNQKGDGKTSLNSKFGY